MYLLIAYCPSGDEKGPKLEASEGGAGPPPSHFRRRDTFLLPVKQRMVADAFCPLFYRRDRSFSALAVLMKQTGQTFPQLTLRTISSFFLTI